MSERTLEQRRAAHALEKARKLEGEAFQDKYRSYVDALPAAIVVNGLGQALASERAGANGGSGDARAHSRLYQHVQSWLCGDNGAAVYPTGTDVLDAITTHPEQSYLLAQAEALAWLEWHKKFCRAYLKKERA